MTDDEREELIFDAAWSIREALRRLGVEHDEAVLEIMMGVLELTLRRFGYDPDEAHALALDGASKVFLDPDA